MSLSTELFAPLRFPALSGGEASDASTQAVQRGYAAGLARGRRRAELERDRLLAAIAADAAAERELDEQRLARAIEALDDARRALDRRVAPVLDEAVRTVFEAGLSLAEVVIGARLADDDRAARTALDRALAHPSARAGVTVRMAPAAIAALAASGVEPPVELVSDPAIARGDAIAELADGVIDARIGSALARARRELLDGGA